MKRTPKEVEAWSHKLVDWVPSEQVNTHSICSPSTQPSKFIIMEHFRFDKFTDFKGHFSNQAKV